MAEHPTPRSESTSKGVVTWVQWDTRLANGELIIRMHRDGRLDGRAIGDDELQLLIAPFV